jgi:hypothetical protein
MHMLAFGVSVHDVVRSLQHSYLGTRQQSHVKSDERSAGNVQGSSIHIMSLAEKTSSLLLQIVKFRLGCVCAS